MLDQLSYYPSPSAKEGANEIVQKITEKGASRVLTWTNNDKKLLYNTAYSIMVDKPPRYSYAAWVMGGLDDYANSTIEKIEKKQIARTKIRGIIRMLGLLHRIYNNTINRMYAPEGTFAKEHALLWNPLLFNPPPPPKFPK